MNFTFSPLRYPGGKTKLYPFVKELLLQNDLLGGTYIEPFAGGSGLALKLLFNEDVSSIVLNDYDPAVYAFWHSVLNHSNELCSSIEDCSVNVDEWKKQKQIYLEKNMQNLLRLGFSTFFLNRTNISGILNGGIIGGIEQAGVYKINSRFNKKRLIGLIQEIAKRRSQISLYGKDAFKFIHDPIFGNKKTFVYFDPPYVKKGTQLYKNALERDDHIKLGSEISNCKATHWIVTYDIDPLVSKIYNRYRKDYLDIRYTINGNRKAREYIFYSDALTINS